MSEIMLPKAEVVIPRFADLPQPIQEVIDRLSAPFPIEEVKVRPGAVKRDGTAALCLAYSDWWTGYLPRLNDEVGPNNWTIALRPWGDHQIIARLEAFGGLIISESSGNAKGDANGAQEAEVQAKKRACAEGLMLGLYYYFLPNVWGKGERIGKDFVFAEGEERRCVWEMYHRAGLTTRSTAGIAIPHSSSRTNQASKPQAGDPPASDGPALETTRSFVPVHARAAAARAVLATAEKTVGLRPAEGEARGPSTAARTEINGATDAQLGLIARLINTLRTTDEAEDQEVAHAIDAVGVRFGLTGLAKLRSKDTLRDAATHVTKQHATKIIDALKALHGSAVARAA